jgi:protein CrcB
MRCGPTSWVVTVTVAMAAASASTARAQRWDDATGAAIGATGEWTNRVEVADLDGDGWVDLLFANGGDQGAAGGPEPQRVFRNLGNWSGTGPHFAEITDAVLGAAAVRRARAILAGDLDGDGGLDLLAAGAHGTASGLFLRRADGGYDDVSTARLPAGPHAIADAALGDVDGDGDLDVVAADTVGDPELVDGLVRVWVNDGAARFVAAPPDRLPAAPLAGARALALGDVDDDGDLDVVIACARGAGAVLWLGDGAGRFTDGSTRLPLAPGATAVAAMDLDGDGDLDLVTADSGPSRRETIWTNEAGRFRDVTATTLGGVANLADVDDRALAFVDVDSDRDADLIVGSRTEPDRPLRNDGAAGFAIVAGALPLATARTTALALADLDHDGRLDVIQAQDDGAPEIVQLAAAGNRTDTAVPVIRVLRRATPADRRVIARVHDRKSGGRPHDWRRLVVELGGPGTRPAIAMRWVGEHLWTATVPDEPALVYRVCATDVAGNPNCGPELTVDPPVDAGADAGDPGGDPGGCCDAGDPRGGALPALAVVVGRARRDPSSSSGQRSARVTRFLLVCAAGAVGTGARYLIALAVATWAATAFPLATLIVNLLGCFLIALVAQLAIASPSFPDHLRVVITTGFLGGLTTYSAFNQEATRLLVDGAPRTGALYLAATLAGCFLMGLAGTLLARRLVGG